MRQAAKTFQHFCAFFGCPENREQGESEQFFAQNLAKMKRSKTMGSLGIFRKIPETYPLIPGPYSWPRPFQSLQERQKDIAEKFF